MEKSQKSRCLEFSHGDALLSCNECAVDMSNDINGKLGEGPRGALCYRHTFL